VRRLLCAIAALAGCASPPKPAPKPPPAPSAPQAIERVAVRRYEAPALPAVSLDVRGVREADLASIEKMREATRRLTGASVGLSGVSVAEAFLLPGFFSGSLVAGGLILAPFAIGLNTMERRQHERIVAALEQTDLIEGTRASLAARLPAPASPPAAALEVIVLAYGLVPKYAGRPAGQLCLTVMAEIVLTAGGHERYRDAVYLEPFHRSADAPPPVCAHMEDFAAKDGAPVRNAALDAAQVLAAIVRQRTPALPWTR